MQHDFQAAALAASLDPGSNDHHKTMKGPPFEDHRFLKTMVLLHLDSFRQFSSRAHGGAGSYARHREADSADVLPFPTHELRLFRRPPEKESQINQWANGPMGWVMRHQLSGTTGRQLGH